jgi:mono/diheme cytochrome c family protein
MRPFLLKSIKFLLAGAILVAIWPFFHIKRVDYSTQIKPLLNKHCLACHGGVKQQGGFSLLTREEALAPTASGKPAIVPGNPASSEMIRRLEYHDPEMRMPYQKPALHRAEIELLKQWVKQGANWDTHWAYRPVVSPQLPKPKATWWGLKPAPIVTWPQQDLDWFVWDKLQQQQLSPAPRAEQHLLAQRASMDLIGLPLPLSLQLQLSRDTNAYPAIVDSLLAMPQFGERWAATWLDLARYADTKGYERDAKRFIWRYRDWVIQAFNQDMPYNQFLTEQLAGDLLPNPTDAQLIATGFHRNTMTNDEGGTDNEEFRVAAVLDRVNTTWTALMSTSFNCVQCHSHPYDPFKHEEYFQFLAFFNNTRDEDTWEDYPALRHFSAADSLKMLRLHGWLGEHVAPETARDIQFFLKTWQPVYYSIAADSFRNCELYDTKWLTMRHQAQARLRHIDLNGKNQLIWRYSAGVEKGQWTVRLDQPDGPVLFQTTVKKTTGREIQQVEFQAVTGVHDLWLQYENPTLATPETAGLMFDWLRFSSPFPGSDKPGGAAARDSFWSLLRAPSEFTPIVVENPADMVRTTRVFERGNWLTPGDTVQAATPKTLPAFPANAPRNRLGLAQWLTDTLHPLTARTMVNRVWEQLFGLGLVETLEDMGSQGISPLHPELLDHLSWRFMHVHHWSVKALLRDIVLSATYGQDSRVSAALLEKDPRNEWLARGPRVRLSAEQLRDKALAVAGKLSAKMYGPGVMPFQPEGIWKSPWNGDQWKQSTGDDQYRRAIYTFVKRSSPYPSAVTFDLAPREVCASRRIRTNTPLQALVTLNDSVFLEAARFLADTIQKQPHLDEKGRITTLYERATGWKITPYKLQALEKLHQQASTYFRQNPEAIAAFMGNKTSGDAQAALTVVANAVLNLDEFLVKS